MDEWINKIVDKKFIQDNLTFAAMFIAVYEHMVDYVVSNIKHFLCDLRVKDGEIDYIKTEKYKSQISNRIVDEKGNKSDTKASFLWLVDNGAITAKEYDKFIAIKDVRNKYAHELSQIIYGGVNDYEIRLLFDMYSLYCKISQWFFIEIESPIIGYSIPENINEYKVLSDGCFALGVVLDVLYDFKSETYKTIINSIRKERRI